MGSGASSLTQAQAIELNRLMKKEFQKDLSGYSDEETKLYLTKKYNEYKSQVLITHKTARAFLYHVEPKVKVDISNELTKFMKRHKDKRQREHLRNRSIHKEDNEETNGNTDCT